MSTDLSPVLSPHTEFFGQTVMRRMQSDNSMPREVPAVSSASSESDEPSPMGCSLADLSPGGKISLVSISLEGFILGNLTSLGSCLSFYYLFLTPSHFWRPPLFVSILAFFSFLRILHLCQMEYEEHKRRQLSDYIQRKPYIVAMTFAFVETLVTSIFFQSWQQKWSVPLVQLVGIALLVVGQFARHAAIATAGTSFNHQVQRTRKDDHVLVTSGIYRYLRHPSYFGFYWWAFGTQLLLGNVFSTSLFGIILWRFFFRRIPVEERALVKMFGDSYVQFRQKTPIGIPLMGYAVDAALRKSSTIP